MRVLGIDPGKVNFGWAIYGNDGLERHGVIDGAEALEDLAAWRIRFSRIVKNYKPDALCVERYARRFGKGGQKESEIMNIMIGHALEICLCRKISCTLVTASTHKGWTAKNFDVQPYPKAKKNGSVEKKWDLGTYEEWKHLAADYSYHEVDAANVAKYGHDVIFTNIGDDDEDDS